jgi:CspA family cold shock protein
MTTSVPVTNAEEIFTGRVKWFNNKAGFGFITITDGGRSGSDIFVHHSAIKVDAEQYKYLVQGEYVELNLVATTTGGTHEVQAVNVCGIKGGKLMCETRREFRTTRNNYREMNVSDVENSEPLKMPRSTRPPTTRPSTQVTGPKVRGQGPRENSEWTYQGQSKRNTRPVRPRMPKQEQSL